MSSDIATIELVDGNAVTTYEDGTSSVAVVQDGIMTQTVGDYTVITQIGYPFGQIVQYNTPE